MRQRLELRDLENEDANSVRYRLLLNVARPLSEKYKAIIWNEAFLNVSNEEWSGARRFERNRAFAGVNVKFDQYSFDVGYMNQFIPRENPDVMEHILTWYIFY